MRENGEKGWRSYRFSQMALMVNDRIENPSEAEVEYYVGLEHLDSDSLKIRRWGTPSDVEATKLRFHVGDIVFGRRRVYQRKLAVAHFEGICSAHAMVLRACPEVACPEFLPFFMQSDLFMERAKEISVGSLSPTINWKALAQEEFLLPPLEEQKRIADLLSSIDQARERLVELKRLQEILLQSVFHWGCSTANHQKEGCIADFCEFVTDGDHNPPRRVSVGVPHLVVANIRDGEIEESGCTYITHADYQRVGKRYSPQGGDVLLTCVGSIGQAAMVPENYIFSADRSLAIYRPLRDRLLPEFCLWMLRSKVSQDYFQSIATGTAQLHLYLKDLRRQPVKLPSVDTQRDVVEHINHVKEQMVSTNRRQAEIAALRAAAFCIFEK